MRLLLRLASSPRSLLARSCSSFSWPLRVAQAAAALTRGHADWGRWQQRQAAMRAAGSCSHRSDAQAGSAAPPRAQAGQPGIPNVRGPCLSRVVSSSAATSSARAVVCPCSAAPSSSHVRPSSAWTWGAAAGAAGHVAHREEERAPLWARGRMAHAPGTVLLGVQAGPNAGQQRPASRAPRNPRHLRKAPLQRLDHALQPPPVACGSRLAVGGLGVDQVQRVHQLLVAAGRGRGRQEVA